MDFITIKDPETKKLLVEQNEIKSLSLKHCKKLLDRNDPKREMERMFEISNEVNEERLNASNDDGFKASKEAFDQVLAKFKSNNKRSYDFLMNASKGFQDSIFLLCRRIIECGSVPDKFRESTLHQIWKREPESQIQIFESNFELN